MRKKKFFILAAVIITALVFISAFASVDVEKMQEINALDLNAKKQEIKSMGTVKPDLDFGKIPLYFITNKGQVNEKAKFYAKASKYTLWLTKDGLVFDSFKKDKVKVEKTHLVPPGHPSQEQHTPSALRGHPSQEGNNKIHRDVSRLIFLNSNKNFDMIPIDKAKLRVNYFIGNDKSEWHCDIPTSMAVLYKNLYKNIDLKVYGLEKQIEYDWIVKTGGDPRNIKFEYKNVKGTRIDEEGNLLIETDFGELMHKKPVSYQEIDMERKAIDVKFKKIAENTYGFEAGAYDRGRDLIIDPVVLAYSTYLGGGSHELGQGIAVDAGGNVYVTGYTVSTDFPTRNQFQGKQGNYDAFITKLDPSRSGAASLLYSTYLGGRSTDYGYGIAVDGSGYAYVTGWTVSTDFPTLNQFQGKQGDWYDVFVTRLDTTQSGASSLLYSTYLGGVYSDYGWGIAVDAGGNAYVTGYTDSTNFPTRNQYQGDQGNVDVFVTRLDTTKSGDSSLLYSTYLGGRDSDYGWGIAVDAGGNAYVTGWTSSTNFPTRNQYQGFQGVTDVFVTRLDTTQSGDSSLLYSTYLGGEHLDQGYAIAVNAGGNAYVTGRTRSTDFPTRNQYQGYRSDWDAFVTRLDTTQSGTSCLLYSTYLGGGLSDQGWAIAVDAGGNAYVTGYTNSFHFPTHNQYQGYQGYGDLFVTKLDPTKSGAHGLLYSTYLGGGNFDGGLAIAVDGSGNAYVTGYTWSADFPTHNQYQGYQGDMDAFVSKISFGPINEPPVAVCSDIEIAADENCEAYITAADVDGGSYDPDQGDEITLSLDNTGPFSPGAHYVELTVTDLEGASDSCFAEVKVYANPSGISNYIQNLPDNYFDKNADQRKKTFKNKFDSVQKLIDAGNYQEAIDKLTNDIRKKIDGNGKNDWVIDPTAQAILTAYIDSMIEYLAGLI